MLSNTNKPNIHDATYHLTSPNSDLRLELGVVEGKAWYSLLKANQVVVEPSFLEMIFADGDKASLTQPISVETNSHDSTWEQPWGEQRLVRNNYNELRLESESLCITFRLFDDSLGFRYQIKGQGRLTIKQERTEFNISPQSKTWWIPAYQKNRYEYLYYQDTLSNIPTSHTPLTSELPTGKFVSIHEAALYNYGAMTLSSTQSGLVSDITPLMDGNAAHVELPFNSPWRTIIVADRAVDLITSRTILNLNEPSKIEDTAWIKPTKFMGIWWALHLDIMTWASGDRHGATTENALRYIDYCFDYQIPALLIEGWNEGWDGDWTLNGADMNQTKPYPDFDIEKIIEYADKKGVAIIGHNETSANMLHYESQLPEAYDYYQRLGVKYIKTGYVGPRINNDEFHHSQIGVNHYQMTVEMAAQRGIMLNIHEPIKGTGIERTWPNLLTREGGIGQEYEGGRVTPEHTTVLPFTRMLAGGMDYTPGLVKLADPRRKIATTAAKQLAYYVTLYSAMQMAADMPENYRDKPQLDFIRQVPVDWEITVPIDGVIGDYFVVARKDRHSENWYIGAVTDEKPREVDVDLSFLDSDRTYNATIYQDHADADWQNNPEAIEVVRKTVKSNQVLHLDLAPGGGAAIQLKPE